MPWHSHRQRRPQRARTQAEHLDLVLHHLVVRLEVELAVGQVWGLNGCGAGGRGQIGQPGVQTALAVGPCVAAIVEVQDPQVMPAEEAGALLCLAHQ